LRPPHQAGVAFTVTAQPMPDSTLR